MGGAGTEAQMASQKLADAARSMLLGGCRVPAACRSTSAFLTGNATIRRPCRLTKIANLTTTALQRLEDASAAILFGDSEDNGQELSNSVLPAVLHRHSWSAGELERCGKGCASASALQARGVR